MQNAAKEDASLTEGEAVRIVILQYIFTAEELQSNKTAQSCSLLEDYEFISDLTENPDVCVRFTLDTGH